MAAYSEETTRALMLSFAEDTHEDHDHEEPSTSPFDQDGVCWDDFWATYADAME
ncbi:MAG: hypothetical protein H7Z42_18255 [Roseiflexaceae bacterium]|nr:hypothetical protein [Roseiflexaceae bacterium]